MEDAAAIAVELKAVRRQLETLEQATSSVYPFNFHIVHSPKEESNRSHQLLTALDDLATNRNLSKRDV